jgi:hypothetical protein
VPGLAVAAIGDQDLTYFAPMASHAFAEVMEKPVPLQAFMPLHELLAPLHALWPLQALPAMHLPPAAYAVVDTVESVAPARNRVAAAAASVAPDLESNFMTISSMIVDTKMRCRRSQNRTTDEVLDVLSAILGNPIQYEVRASSDLVTAVSKESFFFLISTTHLCLTPACKEYFVARQKKQCRVDYVRKSRLFKGLSSMAALRRQGACAFCTATALNHWS